MTPEFKAHCDRARKIVNGWPKWKRNILGAETMTDQMTLPDLDKWCATEVMGWYAFHDRRGPSEVDWWSDQLGETHGQVEDFRPTTNPAQALEVLEKWLKANDKYDPRVLIIYQPISEQWEVVLTFRDRTNVGHKAAPTLPKAVCCAVFAAEGATP